MIKTNIMETHIFETLLTIELIVSFLSSCGIFLTERLSLSEMTKNKYHKAIEYNKWTRILFKIGVISFIIIIVSLIIWYYIYNVR